MITGLAAASHHIKALRVHTTAISLGPAMLDLRSCWTGQGRMFCFTVVPLKLSVGCFAIDCRLEITCQVIKAEASATAHCRGDGENTVRVTMDMSAKLGQDRNNESCKSNTPTVQYTVL